MHPTELRRCLNVGDEVAVMPIGGASPADVLKIDRVAHVGHVFIRTEDERMYAAVDGVDMGELGCLRIELVTEEHRAAMRLRRIAPELRAGRGRATYIHSLGRE